ncbi:MAG: hypothetical protein P1U86_05645 [Verrucomicrobiales bacterium]|nr:hypothetical protein [Verrucomicrobiales bacterium]
MAIRTKRGWAKFISYIENVETQDYIHGEKRYLIFFRGDGESNLRGDWTADEEPGALKRDSNGLFYNLPTYPPEYRDAPGRVGYFDEVFENGKKLVVFFPMKPGPNRLLAIRSSVRQIDHSRSIDGAPVFFERDIPELELWDNFLRFQRGRPQGGFLTWMGYRPPIPNQQRWLYAHLWKGNLGRLKYPEALIDFNRFHEGYPPTTPEASDAYSVLKRWHRDPKAIFRFLKEEKYRYHVTMPLVKKMISFDQENADFRLERLVWIHEDEQDGFLLPIELFNPDFDNALIDLRIVLATNSLLAAGTMPSAPSVEAVTKYETFHYKFVISHDRSQLPDVAIRP